MALAKRAVAGVRRSLTEKGSFMNMMSGGEEEEEEIDWGEPTIESCDGCLSAMEVVRTGPLEPGLATILGGARPGSAGRQIRFVRRCTCSGCSTL